MKRDVTMSLLCLIFLGTSAFGSQTPPRSGSQEIRDLVSQLSWDSVGGECNFMFRVFPTGEAVDRLIKIGKPATDELLKALEDEERVVAAHMILTAIWEPEKAGGYTWANIRYVYEGESLKPAYWVLTSNGLSWSWSEEKNNVVAKKDLIEIGAKWQRKVKQR